MCLLSTCVFSQVQKYLMCRMCVSVACVDMCVQTDTRSAESRLEIVNYINLCVCVVGVCIP